MLQAEKFYQAVLEAQRLMPDGLDREGVDSLGTLLISAAGSVAEELAPQSLLVVRFYENIGDERIAEALIEYLVDQSPEGEWDCMFGFYHDIGIAKVVNAPVETPAELSQWILAEHRALFDGRACFRCSEPVPYDEAMSFSNDSDGARCSHERCFEASLAEYRQSQLTALAEGKPLAAYR